MSARTKAWFITGASRGLGRVLAEAALQAGDFVATTTRNPDLLQNLKQVFRDRLLVLDTVASDRNQASKAVGFAAERFGVLDVVVTNAAWAVFSSAEDLGEEDLRTQMEVNFFGAVHVIQAAIPIFREQRSGRIIQVSSICTRRPGAGLAGYSAAKWALAGFATSLARELAPFNVKVTLVEPGGMRTSMTDHTPARQITPAYAQTVGREIERLLARRGEEPIDPAKVAQVLLLLTDEADPPIRLVLGSDALERAEAVHQTQVASDQAWASVSRSVDFTAKESRRRG